MPAVEQSVLQENKKTIRAWLSSGVPEDRQYCQGSRRGTLACKQHLFGHAQQWCHIALPLLGLLACENFFESIQERLHLLRNIVVPLHM